jgi:hypothetical protein
MEVAKRSILATTFFSLVLAGGCSISNSPSPSSANPAPTPVGKPGTASADTSKELLDELLQEDTADAEELEYYDPQEVKKALLAAQPKAVGKRAVAIAYLLASLGENYDANRGIVLNAFNEYFQHPESAEDDPVDYTVSLCNRGDDSLTKSLMLVADKAKGETSETLSIFYSESLVDDTEGFLKILTSLPVENQKKVAALAAADLSTASEDGISDETFDEVYEKLVIIAGGTRKSGLRQAARLCLEAINAELTDSEDESQQLTS